jgi:hypothetical protein
MALTLAKAACLFSFFGFLHIGSGRSGSGGGGASSFLGSLLLKPDTIPEEAKKHRLS